MKITDAFGQAVRYAAQGMSDAKAMAAAQAGAAADRWRGTPDATHLRYGYLIRHVQLARESMATYRRLARTAPEQPGIHATDAINRFILFIGYSRSGHSLIAALLDAHPNVVVSHELHAVKHLKAGSSFSEVARAIQLNSYYFNHYGRGYSGYDYRVPGQHQGSCATLKVLGDKKANGTCRALLKDPELVQWLERTIPVPLSFIHVIRNPWDNIASKARRTGMSLQGAADSYLRNAAAIGVLRRRYPEQVVDVYLDDFSAAPVEQLRMLMNRLGIEADDRYLSDCAAIVFERPLRSRHRFDWPSDVRRHIRTEMSGIDHLRRFADAD